MKKVNAYEAHDGKLFRDAMEAAKYSIAKILEDNDPGDSGGEPTIGGKYTVARILIDHRKEVMEILSETIRAEGPTSTLTPRDDQHFDRRAKGPEWQ